MLKNLTKADALILKKNKVIDSGSSGEIRKISDEILSKLYYFEPYGGELLIDSLLKRDSSNILTLERKQYNKIDQIRLEILREKQDKIKFSTLPLEVALYDEWLIGVYLHYFKGYVNLKKLLPSMCSYEKRILLEQIREKLNELHDNYIYPWDAFMVNILIDPASKNIEFIDLDDFRTEVFDSLDYISKMRSQKALDELKEDIKIGNY